MTALAATVERFDTARADTARERAVALACLATLTAALLPALALNLGLDLGALLLRYP